MQTKSLRTPAETSHNPLLACLQNPLCYAIEQVAGNPPSRAWGFMCTHRGTSPHNQTLPSFRGLETHKQADCMTNDVCGSTIQCKDCKDILVAFLSRTHPPKKTESTTPCGSTWKTMFGDRIRRKPLASFRRKDVRKAAVHVLLPWPFH